MNVHVKSITLLAFLVCLLVATAGNAYAACPTDPCCKAPVSPCAPKPSCYKAPSCSPCPAKEVKVVCDTKEVKYPKFKLLRYDEDWSVLSSIPKENRTLYQKFKYLPLNCDESIWLSFGGQGRVRLESWDSFAFGTPANHNDTFALFRAQLHGDLHITPYFRVFAEGISAWATDRQLPGGKRTMDVDSFDLLNGFVDFNIPFSADNMYPFNSGKFTARVGRQQFAFGKQRLVSPLPWANTYRRWDGVSGILNTDDFVVHGFFSYFTPVDKYDFDEWDNDQKFYGVYATLFNWIDAYFLALERPKVGTGNKRYTVGGRAFDTIGCTNFSYDVEGAYQFGTDNFADVSAWMVAAQLAYQFKNVCWQPRLQVGFDYASGDRDPGGSVNTFNQLFPLGHAYFGFIDTVGRQNLIATHQQISVTPPDFMAMAKAFKFTVTNHIFWRAETLDALYNAGGGVARAGALGAGSYIGDELDLTLNFKVTNYLSFLVGYSHFFEGEFLKNTAGDSDGTNFFYAQAKLTF